ncbi:MAG: DUF488 family protein [Clostridiaceae bacterium]|nr:DUF488 family protein [Clostridiaceae bacterium]
MGKIIYKRIYDLDESDRQRVLVDRLWPRGKSKEMLRITEWPKDITPSTKIRKDYHDGKLDYEAFAAAYEQELADNKSADDFLESLRDLLENGDVTITTSVKDVEHSHMPTLRNYITKMIG